eukprot:433434-Rhodomonas_salina.1
MSQLGRTRAAITDISGACRQTQVDPVLEFLQCTRTSSSSATYMDPVTVTVTVGRWSEPGEQLETVWGSSSRASESCSSCSRAES